MMKKIDYRISLNETNVLKGIAICAMLCHHLFFQNPEYGAIAFKLALTGKFCVALFVFLSGYGMAVQYQKYLTDNQVVQCCKCRTLLKNLRSNLRFLLRRYLKFFMNYWAVFLITVPIGVLVFGRSLDAAYGTESSLLISFIKDLLGLQYNESYNITWWFNRLILSLWLLFPLLYWAMKSKVVCVWVLILLFFNPAGILSRLILLAESLPNYLVIFTMGICIAVHIDEINKILNKVHRYVVLAVSIIATLAFLYMRNHYVLSCFLMIKGDPFIVVFLSFAVVSICRLTHRKMAALAFVGKHSMNMYLVHTFVCSYFFHVFIYGFKYPILIFAVLFAISLLLSIVIEFFKTKVGFYRLLNSVIQTLEVRRKSF